MAILAPERAPLHEHDEPEAGAIDGATSLDGMDAPRCGGGIREGSIHSDCNCWNDQ